MAVFVYTKLYLNCSVSSILYNMIAMEGFASSSSSSSTIYSFYFTLSL